MPCCGAVDGTGVGVERATDDATILALDAKKVVPVL